MHEGPEEGGQGPNIALWEGDLKEDRASGSGEEGPETGPYDPELMECINLVLEHIDDLEELAEKRDKRIHALEEVEDLKPKVCQCARAEEEVRVPEEVKVQLQWIGLSANQTFLPRSPLVWSTNHQVLIWTTWLI